MLPCGSAKPFKSNPALMLIEHFMNITLRLVLDATAFIAGLSPSSLDVETYTTPSVIEELRGRSSHLRYSIAFQMEKLKILHPSQTSLAAVEKASLTLGDKWKLSEADLSILALALELKAQGGEVAIVSDDYSIQNVAGYLGITHNSISATGIRSRIRWALRCTSCRKVLPSNFTGRVCPVCGGEVRRKAISKTSTIHR